MTFNNASYIIYDSHINPIYVLVTDGRIAQPNAAFRSVQKAMK